MSLAGGYVKAHRAVSALLDGNAHVHIEEPMKASASAGHESVINHFFRIEYWHSPLYLVAA
jgi:hypothetical protein